MFRLFGGKRLLQWKDPRTLELIRIREMSFLMKVWHIYGVLVICCFCLLLFILTLTLLFSGPGEQTWLSMIGFNFVISGIGGMILGVFVGSMSYFISPTVLIKERFIQWSDGKGKVEKWHFSQLDKYEIVSEQVDGFWLTFLLFFKDEQAVLAVEVPKVISNNQINEALKIVVFQS